MPNIRLVPNSDGSYDILLEYKKGDVEFAEDFDSKKKLLTSSKRLSDTIASYAKKAKIKTVKILVSGVLVASVALSSLLPVFAAGDRYSMGYLYSGTDHQQIEYVNRTNDALDTVSPSYFNLQEDGSLKLNYVSTYLIDTMHEKGIKVVPFLSNHWNRTAGINALKDVESLSTQIADYVEEYDLDGVNVDIENVTHEQRDQYTQLVRLLREKIPDHKEISVAVAANPNDWQLGWHGSYDYANLAKYADHLVIMAYDEHFEGGEAGPVASIGFVEDSIRYALSKTTPDKIVVGIPFYGRVWSLDSNRIVGKGISSKTIQDILNHCESTITYDEKSQSVKAEFKITETSGKYTVGGDFVLDPGNYVVWFENDASYQAKLGLIQKYDLKGAGSWSLGQEDPSIWNHYDQWLNGESTDSTPPDASTPSAPESSEPPESNEPTVSTPTEEPEIEYVEAWINADETDVPVYKNANLKGKVIATLAGGAAISVRNEGNSGVYQVKLADGQIGYISSDYVTFEENFPESSIPSQPSEPQQPSEPSQPSEPPRPSEPSQPEEPSEAYFVYEVKRGDSLWKIAETFLGSGTLYPEIMAFNGLASETIYPGMQLKIPEGISSETPSLPYQEYTVKRGDSLWKIAQKHLGSGSRYVEIKELNGLTSDTIQPGQILKLPY